MTAQNEERTNEVRVIPDGKPILMKLIGVKASKPQKSRQSDKMTKMVSWVLVVDDRKYPECAGFFVSYRTSSWSASGKNGGRSSNCYLFIAMVLGEGADLFERVDLCEILAPYEEGGRQKLQRPVEMGDLWGKYLVGWMETPRPDDNGRVWQNAKEFKPPEFLDWDVEDRKMPVETQDKQPLGMPIPKNAPPAKRADTLPEAAKEPAPAKQVPTQPPKPTKEPTVAEIDEWIKTNAHNHGELIKWFVREQKQAQRISALSEPDRLHLYLMMKVDSLMMCPVESDRAVATDAVQRHLELRGATSFEDLESSDLKLLIETIEKQLTDEVPF